MTAAEKALFALRAVDHAALENGSRVDGRIRLIVTLVFIVIVLTVPILDPGRLVWFFCFPIVMAEASGIGYGKIFVKSLWVLPLILLIAMFNPILDHEPLWRVGDVTVSRGWVSFITIILRGLLTFQALLLLVMQGGFMALCQSLRRLGCPKALVTQLYLLYRYIGVLLEEAISMERARAARGYGRKNYPLKMWGVFAGQLLLRSVDRAKHVNRAMLARGFDGDMPYSSCSHKFTLTDALYLFGWIALFVGIRILDLSAILGKMLV